VGYIPFDPQAANPMFMLVARRYERASLIVTSNKPFSAWGEIFGNDAAAAAMIDRLIHHAEILFPQGRQLPPQEPTTSPSAHDPQ
jgi:DNA replication protein DnaC